MLYNARVFDPRSFTDSGSIDSGPVDSGRTDSDLADSGFADSRLADPGLRFPSPFFTLLAAVLFGTLVLAQRANATGATEPLTIAVASSFRVAATELAARFEEQTGVRSVLSSGASGMLAAQILKGAPFDLFLSADEARPRAVVGTGEHRDIPVCYARGALVLLGADNLEAALADPTRSLAIANPRSAPYGVAAAAVISRDDFAAGRERRVVRGANVQQALQFYERGAADLALVARAVAGHDGIPVPSTWHTPIDQYAVVLARGERAVTTRRFLSFIRSEAAHVLLRDLGYEPCS